MVPRCRPLRAFATFKHMISAAAFHCEPNCDEQVELYARRGSPRAALLPMLTFVRFIGTVFCAVIIAKRCAGDLAVSCADCSHCTTDACVPACVCADAFTQVKYSGAFGIV